LNPAARWLSIVGLGEDGLDGLSSAARALIASAGLVVGGRRHLSLVAEAVTGQTLAWPSPPDGAFPAIVARRGTAVCVLASGDPFFYGIGSSLARVARAEEMLCLPAASSFGLAAARLGWAVQDCALVTLHGRALERILPHLHPRRRVLALSWDATTPGRLADLLSRHGFGAARITVCEAMGGPRERLRTASASDFRLDAIDPLNLVALDIGAAPDARVIPLTPGLPDAWFEHDGQLTKQDVRALTLAALAPRRGELLWDIGAGSGAIGIEWMLTDPSARANAIERDPVRAARIARNAAALGVPDLAIVAGAAPAALGGLDTPDAIFIGGGATAPGLFETAWTALARGGRLVANGVTLETQALLFDRYRSLGGTLKTIQIAHAGAVGGFHGMRPGMAVTQWAVRKPW
jgi:precorrin-6Y C5,15-methyltransferase (decarboxylating)